MCKLSGIPNAPKRQLSHCLEKNKIKADPELIIDCNFNQQYTYEATQQLLKLQPVFPKAYSIY